MRLPTCYLLRNYEYHHRYTDAADLMVSLATSSADESTRTTGVLQNQAIPSLATVADVISTVDVYKRMEYFTYAVNSGTSAVNNPTLDASTVSSILTVDNVMNIEDQLTVASEDEHIYVTSCPAMPCHAMHLALCTPCTRECVYSM